MSQFKYVSAGVTDVGLVRKANEDSILHAAERGLYVVADGMGGHENGALASTTIVRTLDTIAADTVTAGAFDDMCTRVSQAVHAANAEIFGLANEHAGRMGSTVVALHIADDRFAVFWAGDSRAYLLRDGQLYHLTRDHTMVNDMVAKGMITEDEALSHPMRHVLNKAVGVQALLELDGIADQTRAGDVFLLCSDGLTGLVEDREIAAALSPVNPDYTVKTLLDLVLARGAHDNVSILVVACEEQTHLSFSPLAGVNP
jgi:serine/threonine protein phosphatase PrpC